MSASTASWMVIGNGTSGICGVTSIGGVDQHVSNVTIATISHKEEVIKQDLLNWLIESKKKISNCHKSVLRCGIPT